MLSRVAGGTGCPEGTAGAAAGAAAVVSAMIGGRPVNSILTTWKAKKDLRAKWGGIRSSAQVVSCGTFFWKTMMRKAGLSGWSDFETIRRLVRSIEKSGTYSTTRAV